MRNLLYSRKTPAEIKGIMTDVGGNMRNGKKHKNRTNFANVKTDIESQFDNYSEKFIGHDLENINQSLAISEDEKITVRSLYESGSEYAARLWSELERINGNTKIMCPICGHDFATELDHYVPREKYCEFSIHLWNLIPLCHYCNSKKNVLWLDDHGKRIIFNAYLDRPATSDFWNVTVQIINNLPHISIAVDSKMVQTQSDELGMSTINALELCTFYEDYVNRNLIESIYKIREDRTTFSNVSKGDLWAQRVNTMTAYLRNPQHLSTESMLEYKALLTAEFGAWILNN